MGLTSRWPTRRRVRLAGLGLCVGVLAACSSGAGDSGSNAADVDLKVAIPADTTSVEGDRANVGLNSPNAGIYETLLRMDNQLQVRPGLAESYEFIAPNTWRFTLRQGVKFHDGSELNAQDVVFTFDRYGRIGGQYIKAQVGGTVAVDKYTVDFTSSVPNLKVPLQMVHPIFAIKKAGSDPARQPVGTGPFRFVSYQPKESLTVERFNDYWDQPNKAKPKSITFRYIPDANARLLALQAGDVDIIQDAPLEQLDAINADDRVKIVSSPVGAYEALSVNISGENGTGITQSLAVRQAIAKGIDREQIVETIYGGLAETGASMVPLAVLGPAAGQVLGGPSYDPDGAKQLLESDGWTFDATGIYQKGGQPLALTLVSGFPTPDVHRPLPEVLQQQLRKIGIDMTILEVSDYDDALAKTAGHLYLEKGNQNDADPAFLPRLFASTALEPDSDYGRLFGPGPAVDQLIVAARGTRELDQLRDLSAKMLHELHDVSVTIIPIAGLTNVWAVRQPVEGFAPHSAFVHTSYASVTTS